MTRPSIGPSSDICANITATGASQISTIKLRLHVMTSLFPRLKTRCELALMPRQI